MVVVLYYHPTRRTLMAAVSRLTSKYQATIPREVRRLLHLERGDRVLFEERDGRVTLRKVLPTDFAYLRSVEGTLTEWTSPADEDAYGGL
jgi:AbrB family looped-hinge helix DNA binding protein